MHTPCSFLPFFCLLYSFHSLCIFHLLSSQTYDIQTLFFIFLILWTKFQSLEWIEVIKIETLFWSYQKYICWQIHFFTQSFTFFSKCKNILCYIKIVCNAKKRSIMKPSNQRLLLDNIIESHKLKYFFLVKRFSPLF